MPVEAQSPLTNWTGSLHSVLRVKSVEGWHYVIRHGDTPNDHLWETLVEFTATTNGQFFMPDLRPSYPKLRYYSVTNRRVYGTNRMEGVIIDRAAPCFAFRNPDPLINAPNLLATESLAEPFVEVTSSTVRDAALGTYVVDYRFNFDTNLFYRLALPSQ